MKWGGWKLLGGKLGGFFVVWGGCGVDEVDDDVL